MIQNFTIIIGAAKCGTTTLFDHLAEHPEVCPASTKEPNFFASEEHFARGRAWYESLWRWDPTRHKTALEASTFYSVYPLYPSAARNMAQLDANYKLIYIVRPQMEQIASHFTHALSIGSAWTDPESGWWKGRRINAFFLCSASYAQQLDEYRRYFSSGQILLLELGELRRDPAALLKRICRFIQVDDSFLFSNLSRISNTSQGKVLPRDSWQAIRRVTWLRKMYRRLPFGWRAKLHSVTGKRLSGPLELTQEEKNYIRTVLAADIARFQDEYGLMLSSSNRKT